MPSMKLDTLRYSLTSFTWMYPWLAFLLLHSSCFFSSFSFSSNACSVKNRAPSAKYVCKSSRKSSPSKVIIAKLYNRFGKKFPFETTYQPDRSYFGWRHLPLVLISRLQILFRWLSEVKARSSFFPPFRPASLSYPSLTRTLLCTLLRKLRWRLNDWQPMIAAGKEIKSYLLQ